MKQLINMFPDELDAALCGSNPVAVLPIGSVEQHGPHLLLGCDGYIAHATAAMAAVALGATLFPMIPFSWIGGLRVFAGTIDLRPAITIEYMEQICLEILAQGFAQIILVNSHGGGREAVYAVARAVYKKTRKSVISMYPSAVYDSCPAIYDAWRAHGVEKPDDWAAYEISELLGALSYFGREDLADEVLANNAAALAEFGEIQAEANPALQGARPLGEIGHDYTHECMHVAPRKTVSKSGGLATMRLMAEHIARVSKICLSENAGCMG